MPYSLLILWRDRTRFLSAVLAVAFSAVLIAMQCGLLFGLLICASAPIDHMSADLWIMPTGTSGLAQGYPIPEAWLSRLEERPEIDRAEPLLLGFASWHKPVQGTSEICILIGSRLEDNSIGAIRQIPADVRARLAEPGTVVVDEWDLPILGLNAGEGGVAEMNGHRVQVVGAVHGFQGVNFAYAFCSMETARMLLPQFTQQPDLMMFGLAHCRNPETAAAVAEDLRARYPEMAVYSSKEFSSNVRTYWLFRSKGGAVMVCTVALALLVGFVVASQTLYAAVAASLREYAVLDALGIPRRRLVGLVLAQSFWIGLAGVGLALPVVFAFSWAALLIRARVLLWDWLLVAIAALTMSIALASGVWALRSLRRVEPATLLR